MQNGKELYVWFNKNQCSGQAWHHGSAVSTKACKQEHKEPEVGGKALVVVHSGQTLPESCVPFRFHTFKITVENSETFLRSIQSIPKKLMVMRTELAPCGKKQGLFRLKKNR